MATFADDLDDMDEMLMSSLNDGAVDYLSAGGAVLAAGIEAIVERDVERLNVASGMLDRAVTIDVRKALLQPFDRKGAFLSNAANPVKALGNKVWHIDGIADDDGSMITFYVVP